MMTVGDKYIIIERIGFNNDLITKNYEIKRQTDFSSVIRL